MTPSHFTLKKEFRWAWERNRHTIRKLNPETGYAHLVGGIVNGRYESYAYIYHHEFATTEEVRAFYEERPDLDCPFRFEDA